MPAVPKDTPAGKDEEKKLITSYNGMTSLVVKPQPINLPQYRDLTILDALQ